MRGAQHFQKTPADHYRASSCPPSEHVLVENARWVPQWCVNAPTGREMMSSGSEQTGDVVLRGWPHLDGQSWRTR